MFSSPSNRVQYYDSGSEHRKVVGGSNVGNLQSVFLEWSNEVEIFNPLTWRIHETTISISSIRIDSLETGER